MIIYGDPDLRNLAGSGICAGRAVEESRVRYAARIDENQPEIVKALRAAGASVTPLHRVGHGVSDLLVSVRQHWLVIEVKNPKKPKADQDLTHDQKAWIGLQHAPVFVVKTALEAVDLVQRLR